MVVSIINRFPVQTIALDNSPRESGMTSPVEALRWRDGVLELIDQRRLPVAFDTVRCSNAAEVATAIRDMVVRGAPAIGCAAAFGIALEARAALSKPLDSFDQRLEAAFNALQASRPTAVNLVWALRRMRKVLADNRGSDANQIADVLEAAALGIFNEDISVNHAIGRAGADLIPDGARIMTHCNTGALATAGHGTALGVIRTARDQGKKLSVIANETRPFLQGARLTAWELMEERIPVTLATDSMAGHLMRHDRVDLVIVGADRIAANGDTANKIGTYTLAVLARHHNIPFYVAAPISTFDLNTRTGMEIPIEQRPAEEMTGYAGTRWAPQGVAVFNPAFDVTPATLLTALITERGVLHSPDEAGVRRLLEDVK